MKWPLDPMTLMWIQVATGAMGMLTLVYLCRRLLQARLHSRYPGSLFAQGRLPGRDRARTEEAARREILVQAYSFTADPLTFGLVEAKKRGVTVEIVLDKSNEVDRYSDLHFFIENRMDVKIDHDHAIAHNKIIIIDKKDAHHRQLQLHEPGRRRQRREPADHQGASGVDHPVSREFLQAPRACEAGADPGRRDEGSPAATTGGAHAAQGGVRCRSYDQRARISSPVICSDSTGVKEKP